MNFAKMQWRWKVMLSNSKSWQNCAFARSIKNADEAVMPIGAQKWLVQCKHITIIRQSLSFFISMHHTLLSICRQKFLLLLKELQFICIIQNKWNFLSLISHSPIPHIYSHCWQTILPAKKNAHWSIYLHRLRKLPFASRELSSLYLLP